MKIFKIAIFISLFLAIYFIGLSSPALAKPDCVCCETWKEGSCKANCDLERLITGYSNQCPGGPGVCQFWGCDEGGGGGGIPNRSICAKDNKCTDVYDPLGRPGNCTYDSDCKTAPAPPITCSVSMPAKVNIGTKVDWSVKIQNGPAVVTWQTRGSCTKGSDTCSGPSSSCKGSITLSQGSAYCTVIVKVAGTGGRSTECSDTVYSNTVSGTATLTPTPTILAGTATPTVTPGGATYTPTPTPYITPPGSGGDSSNWFKTEMGNVHSNSDIVDPIPENDFFASYLVTTNGLSTFGPLGTFIAAPERGSKANWFWYSPPYGKVLFSELIGFYNYYVNFKPETKTETISGLNNEFFSSYASSAGMPNIIKISPVGGILSTSEDITLSGDKKIVIYVDGELKVKNNIFINDNAGIVFVVAKDLSFASEVFQADGMYLVDGGVSTKDQETNTPLVIKGGLYVSQNGKIFSSSRTLEEESLPAEWITYEPKYLINFANVLGRTSLIWKEVAP